MARDVTIRNSSVSTSTRGDDDDPDLGGNARLNISSSIAFCTALGSPHGKISLSGSPVFCRAEKDSDEIWVLANNATISRDMTVPLGKDCYIPAWTMLTIAKGKKLYAYGGFIVDGRVKGTVVAPLGSRPHRSLRQRAGCEGQKRGADRAGRAGAFGWTGGSGGVPGPVPSLGSCRSATRASSPRPRFRRWAIRRTSPAPRSTAAAPRRRFPMTVTAPVTKLVILNDGTPPEPLEHPAKCRNGGIGRTN